MLSSLGMWDAWVEGTEPFIGIEFETLKDYPKGWAVTAVSLGSTGLGRETPGPG